MKKNPFVSLVIKALIMSLAVVFCDYIHAQSTQPCIVKQYNQKEQKTPLPGVEVMVSNAGTTVSDNEGKLTLAFRTLKPGDRVNLISAKKAGYELFNTEAVKQWNISREKTPFTLVLVKKAYFEQLKTNLSAISADSYKKKYEQAVMDLEAQKKAGKLKEEEFNRKYDELEAQYQNRLTNLDNYIDQFARIDLSEVSAEEQRILELVQDGRMDEAVQAYEEMELANKLRGEVGDYLGVKDAVRQLEDIRIRKKEKIEALYTSITRELSTMILANMYSKAKDLLVSALDAFLMLMEEDPSAARPKVASLQYQLGNLIYDHYYYVKEDKRAALPYLESALSNYIILETDSPGSYYQSVAQTKTGLGRLAEYTMDLNGAESYYLEALDIWESHMDADGGHRSQLAYIQSLLGDLYQDWREKAGDAERYYLAALHNYSILYQTDPESFLGHIAMLHRALSIAYGRNREYEKREESLLKAEQLFSQLSEKDGLLYLDLLRAVQSDLANYYGVLMPLLNQGEEYAEKAEQYYLAACMTAHKKADYAEIVPSSRESSSWQDLIHFCLKRGDYPKAETYISEFLMLFDERYPDDKERVQARLSIGKAFLNTDSPEKGLPYFQDAKNLYEQSWPEEFLDRGRLCVELAKCYALVGNPTETEVSMSEAFKYFDFYCSADSGDISPELGMDLKLSILAMIDGSFKLEVLALEAEREVYSLPVGEIEDNAVLSILEICFQKEYASLIMRYAANDYVRVAEVQNELAELYSDADDASAAGQWFSSALENLENYKRINPEGFSEFALLADIQKNLGRLFLFEDNTKAEVYLLQSLQNYTRAEELYATQIDTTISFWGESRFDSNQYKKKISDDQKLLGFMYYYDRDDENAEKYLYESIDNYRRYYSTHEDLPYTRGMFFDFSNTQYCLLLVLERMSKMDDYSNWLDYLLKNMESLFTAEPENITYRQRFVELLLRKCMFEADNDRTDNAISLFERAYELDGSRLMDFAACYNQMAYSFARGGHFAKALETIDKAISIQQDNAEYYDSKGEILLMMGDEKGALEMWRKVMEVDPDFLSKHDGTTALYEQLKELKQVD